ncbi:DNA cytosine-5-methyltransferase DRM2 [Nymphaea thermarum]|nr:DNA cytosine-5-methyltransferase DRM2 [Nymphaea thermarum]
MTSKVGDWIVDSGATHHMTGDPKLFQEYKLSSEQQRVSMVDGSSISVAGKGSLSLLNKYLLRNALHVPNIPDLVTGTKIEIGSVIDGLYRLPVSQTSSTTRLGMWNKTCDWELLDSNIPGYDGRTKWIGESSSCGTKRKYSADKRNSKSSQHCAYYSSEEDECYRDAMDSDIPGHNGRMKGIGESSSCGRKRRYNADERNSSLKRQRGYDLDDNAVRSHLWKTSNPMTGFGLPNEPNVRRFRKLPDIVIGPPFFYYENVALTPKGVWETISRFLYDIEPEFVDSKYFSAAARKRGYIHNLPIDNRFQLQPIPPLTIQEALPYTKKWWPSWDPRKKLNCINTCCASARLTDRLRKIVSDSEGTPSYADQQIVLEQCRKWNLVWVGLHKLAPLEPDEIEPLLGFPKHHTRGGGVSRTERLRALGNSFQVDTVAYHLSVLKRMFPYGLNVLSLFSGIGGAEVALHKLGIPLKNVVSIEISEVSRNVLKNWWNETEQKGRLIEIANIEQLTSGKLESMMGAFGGFDLVIGGSPCNNLTGSNRVSVHFIHKIDLCRCGNFICLIADEMEPECWRITAPVSEQSHSQGVEGCHIHGLHPLPQDSSHRLLLSNRGRLTRA